MLSILIIILVIAVATDMLKGKIPNALTIPTMVFGLMYHVNIRGLDGFLFSFEGLLLGLGLLLLFYVSGMMGAGDVKLMGAVGSILGPEGVFKAFLLTAFSGGIYALIVMALYGQLISFMKRMVLSLKIFFLGGGLRLAPNEGMSYPALRYGIAIAVGTSLSFFFNLEILNLIIR